MPYERLAPIRPFVGVTSSAILPLGQVCLPVTFVTHENYWTEFIVFDVASIGLPYGAILVYLTLSKFMAAVHHAYGHVKMLGCSGTLTVRCDEKDVTHPLARAYKAAAPISSGREDAPKPDEPAPAKKKLLFSQERARTKKVSLDVSCGSLPHHWQWPYS